MARSLDLSPGLVNDVPQLAALAPDFDFAVNEECVRLRQCAKLLPFADADKPVFHVEYTGSTDDFCVTTVGYGFASIRKESTLNAWQYPAPSPNPTPRPAHPHAPRPAPAPPPRPRRSRGNRC
ncbi:hypothetical protein GCM10027614_65550 [Micromonospora vulcania]